MCSPTTSPYGYSSFPKEEIGNTIDFLVSLSCDGTDLLVIFVKPGITNVTFRSFIFALCGVELIAQPDTEALLIGIFTTGTEGTVAIDGEVSVGGVKEVFRG